MINEGIDSLDSILKASSFAVSISMLVDCCACRKFVQDLVKSPLSASSSLDNAILTDSSKNLSTCQSVRQFLPLSLTKLQANVTSSSSRDDASSAMHQEGKRIK